MTFHLHLPIFLHLPSPSPPHPALRALRSIPGLFPGRPAGGRRRDGALLQAPSLHHLQDNINDNLILTQDNKTSDSITTVTPGLKYKTEGPAYKFDLGFDLGMNFYASNSDLNYISYNGHLDTSYSFTPRWTVKLYETITRSRDNLQNYALPSPGGPQTFTSSSTGQGLYLRILSLPSNTNSAGKMWPP